MPRIAIIVILLISAIITAGIFLGLYFLLYSSEFDGFPIEEGPIETYQETFTYKFNPSSPASIIDLEINVDVTKINIEYVSTSQYLAKLEMKFQISGPNAGSKTHTDWFNSMSWQATNGLVSFKLDIRDNIWGTITSMDNELTVSLKKGTIFNVNAISSTGGIEIDIPNGEKVGNFKLDDNTGKIILNANGADFANGIDIHSTTGNKELDVSNCIMGGNIKIEGSTGNLLFKSENMKYTKDSSWDIDSSTGNIEIDIIQKHVIGFDVTGTIEVSTGQIRMNYEDESSNIGARFSSSTSTGTITYLGSGFSKSNEVYTSNDFNSASNTYDLNLESSTGIISIEAESA